MSPGITKISDEMRQRREKVHANSDITTKKNIFINFYWLNKAHISRLNKA